MTEIKLAEPVPWKEAEPSETGFIFNYKDVLAERKEWQKRIANEREFNRQLFSLLEKVGLSIVPDLDEIGDGVWRVNKVVVINRRAEKAEARLKEAADELNNIVKDIESGIWKPVAIKIELRELAKELRDAK